MASHSRRVVVFLVVTALVGLTVARWSDTGGQGSAPSSTTVTSALSTRPYSAADPLRVLLLGDSLAWEAKKPFTLALEANGNASARAMAFGGTDYCTFDEELRRVVPVDRPEVAVVEFSGNALGDCMADPLTGRPLEGDALVERFRRDAERTTDYLVAQGVTVYLVSIPASRDPHPENPALYRAIRDTVAGEPALRYLDAARAVERPGGGYTDYLPCLPDEPCTTKDPRTGKLAAEVRASDGVHFCPSGLSAVAGVTLECGVWSSGAWRYGTAMAAAVLRDFDLDH